MSLQPGQDLSHYRILEKIGEGGMGAVYKARDLRLGRLVAIKILPQAAGKQAARERRERLFQEARAASALDHPGIGTIHEVDESADGRLFVVMAYYAGESLAARIRRAPLPVSEVIRLGAQVAAGLAKAHAKGIVHRDVKPANIMITEEGDARIIDFGLATLDDATRLTKPGSIAGSVAYMSPERIDGKRGDDRADAWSLGVVLYEALTGRLPFHGESLGAITRAVLDREPAALGGPDREIPEELVGIIKQALVKNPSERCSCSELQSDLAALGSTSREQMETRTLRAPVRASRGPMAATLTVAAGALVLAGAAWWLAERARIERARTEGLAALEAAIDEGRTQDAFTLAGQIEETHPGEAALDDLWPLFSEVATINSTPPGASVYMSFYAEPSGPWRLLGRTPLSNQRVPAGVAQYRVELEGFAVVHRAVDFNTIPEVSITLDPAGSLPEGMVRAEGGRAFGWLAGLDPFLGATLEDYFIDVHEVTNREFKEFVDAGGYAEPSYWRHPFVESGRELRREEAMERFLDATGRPGPSGWELGTYPDGQGDLPVGGVSWYEAAAYAEWAGKSLPTVFHWIMAAGPFYSVEITALSNFGSDSPAPVGSHRGMGRFGTYDMAGNVREWCLNESAAGRFILGGAWEDQAYTFRNAGVRPPMERSPGNGFRCVLYPAGSPPEAAARRLEPVTRDYTREIPASDEAYRIYRERFSYDPRPLNAEVDAVDESHDRYIRQRVSFDAAYGGERVIAYLFLPRHVPPPYQAVVYYPGTGSTMSDSIDSVLGKKEIALVDFLVHAGRALVYPILKATHERNEGLESTWPNTSHRYADYLTSWVKDIRRTIDYLEEREDIDHLRLAYFGFSWGARYGAIIPAVEERLKVNVLVSGGLVPARARPEVDQINYVTRVKQPTLMINGRFDTTHPLETAQKPMLALLGAPPEHKRHVIYDAGHMPPRNSFRRETLDWLDRYLGPVK